jgi:hypothetical protein
MKRDATLSHPVFTPVSAHRFAVHFAQGALSVTPIFCIYLLTIPLPIVLHCDHYGPQGLILTAS